MKKVFVELMAKMASLANQVVLGLEALDFLEQRVTEDLSVIQVPLAWTQFLDLWEMSASWAEWDLRDRVDFLDL